MFKTILFIVLLLMYPVVLHYMHITGYRVVPLVVPYCTGVLCIIILGSNFTEWIAGLIRKRKSGEQPRD